VGSRGRLDLYCTKFINKTLFSSLPVDVGQVWSEPSWIIVLLLLLLFCLCIACLLYNSFYFASIVILSSSTNVSPGTNN